MKKLLIPFFLLGLLINACKKDDTVAPSMVGYWTGKYGNGSAAATLEYAFLFDANGTVKIYANNADTAKANKAQGTYFISGTKVNGSYTYPGNIKYSFTAISDEKFTTMSGSWGSGTTTTGNTFFLNKK
jgi:hypothetical protein